MVTFLILFLILLIATAFYLTFTNKKNGQINKRKVNSKNSVSNKLSYKKSIYTDRVDQMDENHPLQELSNISESFDKYNNDSSVAQSDSGELFIKTKTNLLNLHVDAMIQAANTFKPCDQISMLNLNDQLHTITAEIIEQINKLTIDPSQILVISKKIEALALIEEYLVNLTNTYEKLVNKELTEESFKEMIEDTLGVAPSSELGRSEYKKFLDFYIVYKAFRAVTPFLEIQLQEIQDFTQAILEIITTSNGELTNDQFENLQNIRPQLLIRYRNFFSHFSALNNGIFEGLKVLKSSAIRDFKESQSTLIEIIENLDNQIETCNYFASGAGKSENEFNSYFNKIKNIMNSSKSAKIIGIGLIESSQSFFEARAVDADKLLNCPYVKKLDQILARVLRTIERL